MRRTVCFLLFACTALAGCRTAPVTVVGRQRMRMEVTAYCACEKCCGWEHNDQGQPVYAYGPHQGRPKQIGICADGTAAAVGVAAADTDYYPFGTVLEVPGYGIATVHDRGRDIRGPHRLDLFFSTHEQALAWGRRVLWVTVRPKPAPEYL
jgi:3D (Asp-Asp-Asp) domain-containing protein